MSNNSASTNKSTTLTKRSTDLLPTYYRTEKNSKFLSGTIDQLISPPKIERLDGYVGSKLTKNYNPSTDFYINQSTSLRSTYELEPGLVVKDIDQNIKKVFSYDDLINSISVQGGNASNLDYLFRPEFYSYNPPIDWDKFVNFGEYFWISSGPLAVLIAGTAATSVSTFTVTDSAEGNSFIFTTEGLTPNPILTLHRGETYEFKVAASSKFYIKTSPTTDNENLYTTGVTDNGTVLVKFTVPSNAPKNLYYASDTNPFANGRISVKKKTEAYILNVEKEILGKQTYSTGAVELLNGMRIKFTNDVLPTIYRGREFYVEGVGSAIVLTDISELQTPEPLLAEFINAKFDGTSFDKYPFDAFKNIPIVPEYITINRASDDRNSWARYNRWFHRSVIEQSLIANGFPPSFDTSLRAIRPIVEFNANLQLFNFGNKFIGNVTLIDNSTIDVFSTVENYPVGYSDDPITNIRSVSTSYAVDGILLDDGYQVVFNADTDDLVRGKIYDVSITLDPLSGGTRGNINLTLAEKQPINGSSILVINGEINAASQWGYSAGEWILSQERTTRNQFPLFDLFDESGVGYSSLLTTTFIGSNIFGYKIGVGTPDPVLGFPISYSPGINTSGTYQFNNYFSTDEFFVTANGITTTVLAKHAYFKINHSDGTDELANVWTDTYQYPIPILQVNEVINALYVDVTAVTNPGTLTDLSIDVYLDDKKYTDFSLVKLLSTLRVSFPVAITGTVLLKLTTTAAPSATGYYEAPINLTNNPYNANISDFTFSELSDHVRTMVNRSPNFNGDFPGISNLNSISDISKYGSRLISNVNSLAYAQHFISDIDHNAINAIRHASNKYNQFKTALFKLISSLQTEDSAAIHLDMLLATINENKNQLFSFSESDMLAYGNNKTSREYTVTDYQNQYYFISSQFNINDPQFKSILVYLNDVQLIHGIDYEFEATSSYVKIITTLVRGDKITINEYNDTRYCFIASTPTKLGLYPKYTPLKYLDDTYAASPINVIQGHDGSITVAYNDFRDDIILEFEKRIFNNLKIAFNPAFMDLTTVMPGAFRQNKFSKLFIDAASQGDFLSWTTFYGLDFETNSTYDVNNHKTYNYKLTTPTSIQIPGNWRAIYKWYFDTDRPSTAPWEMLGFSMMPTWWEAEYGPVPYTAGNKNLWDDLELGRIAQGERAGVDERYVRPGLSSLIPVDENGNIVDVRSWAVIGSAEYFDGTYEDWSFGDHGPVETSWKRSSHWPFIVQIMLALTNTARYFSIMASPANVQKNIVNQYVYDYDNNFLTPTGLINSLSNSAVPLSGYLSYVVEFGKTKSQNYVQQLIDDLTYAEFNLVNKIGGFVSKDKLQIVVDSISPNTVNPGVLLPQEDYALHFNTSGHIKSIGISGIIIKKSVEKFVVKGYDRKNAYFSILKPVHQSSDKTLTVGGRSSPYLNWSANAFYQVGQVVQYSFEFYTVLVSHASETFIFSNFRKLSTLPVIGGSSVLRAEKFEITPTIINYGTKFSSIQEVYDFIIGYGKWLESQGIIFDEYSDEIKQVINWDFSTKEFLYWTTQRWAEGSVISLSPFANSVKISIPTFFVDSFLNPQYEYSLLTVDGTSFQRGNFSVDRDEGLCTITTKNTNAGLFFVRVNLIQKEHVIVMKNSSIFNDIIYDNETGYRQLRVKLIGFKTSDWNGEYFSPGFVYDPASIASWSSYTDYTAGDVVKYAGNYYSAIKNIPGTETFSFTAWAFLEKKPAAQLLPNFDYKIGQFDDFYSLDIDNLDSDQQKMAQHLIGYTPRSYLDNIFLNPIAQYKFYQGYIKEKGTRNAIEKLAKASTHNLQGKIEFDEDWAFRIGSYGGYNTFREIEFSLKESEFIENSQVIIFTDTAPLLNSENYSYIINSDLSIIPPNYDATSVFDTIAGTVDDTNIILPVAGYVRTDDITATAVNKQNILDITNVNAIKEGDTIWLGFTDNNDWDVYRYTSTIPKIIAASITIPVAELTFTTDRIHNLVVGETIAVTRISDILDGVYIVTGVTTLTQFTVATTLATMVPITPVGLLFKFVSSRYDTFDALANNKYITQIKFDELAWIDRDINDKWAVYKKVQNFNLANDITLLGGSPVQEFGNVIVASTDSNTLIIAAPSYYNSASTVLGTGRIVVRVKNNNEYESLVTYGINTSINYYFQETTKPRFGDAIIYNSVSDMIIAGAPYAGNIREDRSGSTYIANSANGVVISTATGLVKISTLDRAYLPAKVTDHLVLISQEPQDNSLFGSSIFLSTQPTSTMLISAPGYDTSTGKVFAYTLVDNSGIIVVNSVGALTAASIAPGSLFGTKISGSSDGSVVAISAPGHNNNYGALFIFSINNSGEYQLSQTISATDASISNMLSQGDKLGSDVLVSQDGAYIFISSTVATTYDTHPGKVFIYKNNGGAYVLSQVINNPSNDVELYFGATITANASATRLVISAVGTNQHAKITFDNNATTFDSDSTKFGSVVKGSGTVYTFTRIGEQFVFAEELFDTSVSEFSNYGSTVFSNNDTIYVGAPENFKNNSHRGSVSIFDTIDSSVDTWQLFRQQIELVDLSKIKRAVTVDSFDDSVVDYIDIIDPLKGKLPGIAEQELRFNTAFDPAVYSIGGTSQVADVSVNWLDEHVGQLWWDLSTTKYIWYEQGDLEYRKHAWGALFPGCTIDIYEWVKSEYLPSQWAELADTNEGLAIGISGQPKHADDTVLSVGQYYNAVSATFTNVYYFWVKNKVIVPTNADRRISAYEVSSLLANTKLSGIQFMSIISPNALSFTNIKTSLTSDRIKLNLNYDEINNSVNRHTEWLLIEDGSSTSMPNSMLNKKLFDSLLGRDSLGNQVPDMSLPEKMRYGIEIRPRQSMFKDRRAALRNIFSYVNTVLSNTITVEFIDFTRLLSQDPLPDAADSEFDISINENSDLSTVNINNVVPAVLSCTISSTGKILAVSIDTPGSGYGKLVGITDTPGRWIGPTITVDDGTTTAILKSKIDVNGGIVEVDIIDAGIGFITPPTLNIRPYTVLVLSDVTSGNKWSKYIRDENTWVKIQVQQYNTPLYWDYIDWKSSTFNALQSVFATVNEVFSLATIQPDAGQYVKVVNQGDGRYIILEKIDKLTYQYGSFNEDYNIVYSELGTFKIRDSIWDTTNSTLGFDQISTFDDTLFDQTPDIETENILVALKDDIFINDKKGNWNKLFFSAVKYAFTEQKSLDWVFKTSFINVRNVAGSLDQRPVYKFQNSQYFEDYLKEVKPYHTQIRNFSTNYDSIEQTRTLTSDFDLPAVYNAEANLFESVTLDSPEVYNYPHRNWLDNYKFNVDSISIGYSGSGYSTVPIIEIIPAVGDIITTPATADAYISFGKVYYIEVTNAGSGYTKTPTVLIKGGGNTTIDTARAYVILKNETTRSNLIGIKFDRISMDREIITKEVTDNFITDGFIRTFDLTWAAKPDIGNISVFINNIELLPDEFYVKNYTANYLDPRQLGNPYKKYYSQIIVNDGVIPKRNVTINADTVLDTPKDSDIIYISTLSNTSTNIAIGQLISFNQATVGISTVTSITTVNSTKIRIGVSPKTAKAISAGTRLKFINPENASTATVYYNKSLSLYNAADRVMDYYTPTIGMPGQSLNQVMSGIDYPGVELQTLPFNYSSNWDSLPFGSVFWEDTDNLAKLDTVIEGGDLTTTGTSRSFLTAAGINPEDNIIDGYKFLSEYASHAPEEMIPGEIKESLGISVFTRVFTGAGVIITNSYPVTTTETSVSFVLGAVPTSNGSLLVSYNNVNLIKDIDFELDFSTRILTLPPQEKTGSLYVTIVGVGGERFLSTDSTSVVGVTSATVESGSIFSDIGSAYVTVNGSKITTNTNDSTYYTIAPVSKKNKRGSAKVYGLSTGTNTITAWFFNSTGQQFNEINEQNIIYDGRTREFRFTLTNPPRQLWSQSSQAIVEYQGKRLIPPNSSYYTVEAGQRVFDLDPNNNYPSITFDYSRLEVHVNGIKIRDLIDYKMNQALDKIVFNVGFLVEGDELAITILRDCDYYILNNEITIVPSRISVNTVDTIRVITYSNHDQLYIRQEVFDVNVGGVYKISRRVFNDNYVWVSIDGNSLVSKVDYHVMDDLLTIKINDDIAYSETSQITVMTFDDSYSDFTIGYRIFKDMVGRTHFKRLSKENTTYLTADLTIDSTSISVNNAKMLPTPSPENRVPGIIFIDGERIEYMSKIGNTLSRITRATLGTGARSVYSIGTTVVDQGASQTIPFTEAIISQQFTATNTTTYIITDIMFDAGITTHDQVEVFYGGRLLEKPTKAGVIRTAHDITIAYDSGENAGEYILSPEYTITVTSATSALLNISIPILAGTTITVVKRQTSLWYEPGIATPANGESLLTTNTVQAQFLRYKPASLPDKYYYAQQ